MTGPHDDFDKRHRLAMEELAPSSIKAWNYDPPLHRALRRLGIKLRPPHYQTQSVNAAIFGVPFAVLFGVIMWLLPWPANDGPIGVFILLVVLAGAMFGWLMARSCRRDAAAAELTDWDDLSSDGNTG